MWYMINMSIYYVIKRHHSSILVNRVLSRLSELSDFMDVVLVVLTILPRRDGSYSGSESSES